MRRAGLRYHRLLSVREKGSLMLKLYYGPGACSFVPHVALETIQAATGQAFEAQALKLHRGEHQTPDYLALNPDGLVPVLLVDGQPLTQILAICDYLDRCFPQAGLLPADPWARAQAMSVFAWMNNTVHPTFTHIYRTEKFAQSETTLAEVKSMAVTAFRQHLERIQNLIGQATPFLCGEQPGFVDAYALVFLRWAGLAGIDPASLPTYQAYVQRLSQQPAVAAAIAREGIKLDTYKPR